MRDVAILEKGSLKDRKRQQQRQLQRTKHPPVNGNVKPLLLMTVFKKNSPK
jgi:hypothetical protein